MAVGKGMAVAVLNHNESAFYGVPAKAFEELMALVEDLELDRPSASRLADGQDPCGSALLPSESGFALQAPTRIVG